MQGMAICFLLDVRYLGLPRLLAEHVVQTSCQYSSRSQSSVIVTANTFLIWLFLVGCSDTTHLVHADLGSKRRTR